ATVLLLVQASGARGLVAFYNFVVNLSTMAAVIPYAFCALAGAIILRGAKHAPNKERQSRFSLVEIVAFAFAVWTIYGCGADAVLYGLLLLLLGIPVYVGMRSRAVQRETTLRRGIQSVEPDFDVHLRSPHPDPRAL